MTTSRVVLDREETVPDEMTLKRVLAGAYPAFEEILTGITVLLLLWSCTRPISAFAQTQDPHEAQPERPTVATHAGYCRAWLAGD